MKKLMIPIACLFLFFVSCKKDKDDAMDTSRSELIVGTWTAVAYGTDKNGDNILQESEKEPITEGVSLLQTYNADGTGKIVTKGPGTPANTTSTTWRFINNDQILEVDEGSKITKARILTLTSNEVSGYDESITPHVIMIFKK